MKEAEACVMCASKKGINTRNQIYWKEKEKFLCLKTTTTKNGKFDSPFFYFLNGGRKRFLTKEKKKKNNSLSCSLVSDIPA